MWYVSIYLWVKENVMYVDHILLRKEMFYLMTHSVHFMNYYEEL